MIQISAGPDLPVAVGGHAAGLIRGVPVAAGGTGWTDDKQHKFWSRDTFVMQDGQWAKGPALPVPLADMAFASDDDGLCVAGGTSDKTPTAKAFRLSSTATGAEWEPLADLPVATEAASGAIVGHTFYVVGGYADNKVSNAVWSLALDRANAKWQPHAALPAPGRGWGAMTVVGGKLFYFGGFASPPYQKELVVFGDAYCYDPATDRWSALPGFDLPGYGWSAVDAGDGAVLLAGRVAEVGRTGDEIWLVRPADGLKRLVGRLPQADCCMAVVPQGDRAWWLTGGEPATTRVRTATTNLLTLQGGPGHE